MSTIIDGSFTSLATPVSTFIALPPGYTEFRMVNITDVGSASATTFVMRAQGTSLMAAGSAYRNLKTNGFATLQLESMITAGGFTFVDPSNPITYPVTAVTAISSAILASVTANGHGLSQGDTVRFTSVNGTMAGMSGLLFTVNSITNANVFTITLDSRGVFGGTPATAGFVQKVISSRFSPHNIVVGPTATIASGNNLILALNTVPSVDQGASQYSPFQTPYQIGAKLRFYLPTVPSYGTPQTANFINVQVVGYAAALAGYNYQNQIILSIQPGNPVGSITTAAGLAALVYPALAAGFTAQYPYLTDIAEVPTIFSEAEDNTAAYGILVGPQVQGDGATPSANGGSLYQWFARKGFSI